MNWSVRKPENIDTHESPAPVPLLASYLWYLDLLLDVDRVCGPRGAGAGGTRAGAIEAGARARPAQLEAARTAWSRGRELPLTQHL